MASDPQPRARSPEEQLGYKVIGRLIAARRRRLGWSQRYLEDRSGIDQAVISRLENGKQFGVRWARFATLVGAMGGLDDEPHPRDLPDRPSVLIPPPIDLERGGLGAFDEDGLVELGETRPPDPVPARNEAQPSPPPSVAHDSVFDDDS